MLMLLLYGTLRTFCTPDDVICEILMCHYSVVFGTALQAVFAICVLESEGAAPGYS